MTEPEIIACIRAEMKAQGMSWRELEDRSGVVRSSPKRWFQGSCTITVFTLLCLLGALGLELTIRKKEGT